MNGPIKLLAYQYRDHRMFIKSNMAVVSFCSMKEVIRDAVRLIS